MRTGKWSAPFELVWWPAADEVVRISSSIGEAAGNMWRGVAATANGTLRFAFGPANSVGAAAIFTDRRGWCAARRRSDLERHQLRRRQRGKQLTLHFRYARDVASRAIGRSESELRFTLAWRELHGREILPGARTSTSPAAGPPNSTRVPIPRLND